LLNGEESKQPPTFTPLYQALVAHLQHLQVLTSIFIFIFIFFRFCDVAQVVIIHKYIQPNLGIFKI
jgi:hypothetical protein